MIKIGKNRLNWAFKYILQYYEEFKYNYMGRIHYRELACSITSDCINLKSNFHCIVLFHLFDRCGADRSFMLLHIESKWAFKVI